MNENSMERKLRAILSADVKGYSILMAEDEIATIRTIKSHRQTMNALIAGHKGRVVDSPGDNLLAEFKSVVDAVQCAVEMQKALKTKNDGLPKGRRMHFRMGVNVGDVVHEGDRLYGEGVNIASRIEGLADAGGVCISRNAYDHIKNKLELGYEYLGEHEVKNVKEPVRVYRVLMSSEDTGKQIVEKRGSTKKKWVWIAAAISIFLLGISAGVFWNYFYLPDPVDIDPEGKMTFDLPKGPSVAVLPFDNMTGDPDQEFFCAGITENIISALSHVPRLFVIARNSTFAYKGKSVKVQHIGRELGAQYIIEGSIQKFNELIRVTVQLVETETGNHIWSEVYDRRVADIFRLQDDIAIQVCEAMQIQITEGETFRNRYSGIENVKIGMKVIKALEYLRYHQNPESITLGLKEIEDVIEMGCETQITYGLLGFYYLYAIETGVCENPIICFGKATEAARKALSFDENTSDVNILSAYLFLMRGQHENAINAAKRAISLNPNNADAYTTLGYILIYSGRPEEAILFIKKAIRLDPIPAVMYLFNLGVAYQESKKYKIAIEQYKAVIKRDPKFRGAYIRMAGAYSFLGDMVKAREAASNVLKIDPNFNLKGFVSKLPYKDKAVNERYVNALRKAGLPE
jgi:adenylate cyclase